MVIYHKAAQQKSITTLILYKAEEAQALKVDIIDFSSYLEKQASSYDKIIIKMDIEGAEISVLDSLIENNTHSFIDILYIEFHSQFQSEPDRQNTANREREIIRILKKSGIKVRIWH